MKIAIWSVTRNGGEKAIKISKAIGGTVFTLKKFDISDTNQFESLNIAVGENFNSYDSHVFIMSTGIVVRTISKFIKGKDYDPAVVVIDENITFAISLISGHIGGANLFTESISEILGITPIITTSSDITGKIAIDVLAEKLNCRMRNLDEAKILTSLIVDNKSVELFLPSNVILNNGKGNNEKLNNTTTLNSKDNLSESNKDSSPEGIVIMSNRENIKITQLFPKNIILGIGCRRGVLTSTVLAAITTALDKVNISKKSIKHIATVDLKKDEVGIIESSNILGVEMKIVSRSEIEECPLIFKSSEFVKEKIGVPSVSAPVAYLTSDKYGKFLLEKFILDGVTVSIYENAIN